MNPTLHTPWEKPYSWNRSIFEKQVFLRFQSCSWVEITEPLLSFTPVRGVVHFVRHTTVREKQWNKTVDQDVQRRLGRHQQEAALRGYRRGQEEEEEALCSVWPEWKRVPLLGRGTFTLSDCLRVTNKSFLGHFCFFIGLWHHRVS